MTFDPNSLYFCIVVWRVSTLLVQRSRVRLVMFTLMESIHTLSGERKKERQKEREKKKQRH